MSRRAVSAEKSFELELSSAPALAIAVVGGAYCFGRRGGGESGSGDDGGGCGVNPADDDSAGELLHAAGVDFVFESPRVKPSNGAADTGSVVAGSVSSLSVLCATCVSGAASGKGLDEQSGEVS